MVQLSHSDMTTGKNIVLTRQTFVGKVMSLVSAETKMRFGYRVETQVMNTYLAANTMAKASGFSGSTVAEF